MLFNRKGNKHRRPSKAVRVATLAGVAGAAVAVPLM
ncbi:transglycosylase, partial [Streptomyces sp. SID7803]|nr:transglycosylase [Streptomyces sp. SID7803]